MDSVFHTPSGTVGIARVLRGVDGHQREVEATRPLK